MTTGTRSHPGTGPTSLTAGKGWWSRSAALRRTSGAQSVLERIRAVVVAARPSAAVRYGLAAFIIVGIALLRSFLFASFPGFFLFTPAIVVIALVLGGGAGLLANLLATVCVGFVFLDIEPVGTLSPAQWAVTTLFAATNLGLTGLVVALRIALVAADTSQASLSRSVVATVEREAFLTSVLASSTDCIKVLDLDGKLTFMSEGGQRVMEVSDFNAVEGCPWPDFWTSSGHAEAVAALAGAREGRSSDFVGRASTMQGTPKWWHVAVSPIRGADGRPDRILSVSRDITALRESEARAEVNAERVRLALAAGAIIGTWFWDIPSDRFTVDEAFATNFGLDPALGREGIPLAQIVETVHPDDQAKLAAAIAEAIERGGRYAHQYRVRRRDGQYYWLEANGRVDLAPDGRPLSFPGVLLDIEERRAAEENMRLLNGELAHRLKNVLAVVQSVTRQTLRNASDVQTASENLSARLVALGAATDVLTNASWRSADLKELVERALAPHGQLGQRILLDGPSVTLQPQVAVSLVLALHELATNAAKYGALSNDAGTVAVDWRVDGEGPEARFHLTWQERGGPPVQAPTRRGFGSTLIERSLKSYFGGTAVTEFQPEGLVFTLDARMGDAALGNGKKA